jgi:hypothetical protein
MTSLFFRDYFKNRFEYEIEMAKYVREDVLEPAKKFIDNQTNLGKKFYNDFKKYEKDWHTAINQAEKVA